MGIYDDHHLYWEGSLFNMMMLKMMMGWENNPFNLFFFMFFWGLSFWGVIFFWLSFYVRNEPQSLQIVSSAGIEPQLGKGWSLLHTKKQLMVMLIPMLQMMMSIMMVMSMMMMMINMMMMIKWTWRRTVSPSKLSPAATFVSRFSPDNAGQLASDKELYFSNFFQSFYTEWFVRK